MSDVTPSPAKGAKPDQQKQMIMLAVLGVVFLLVLVFMVLKPFSGGGDTSAPPAPVVTESAPVDGAAAAPDAVVSAETAETGEATAPAPPPSRPSRTPFDPPR